MQVHVQQHWRVLTANKCQSTQPEVAVCTAIHLMQHSDTTGALLRLLAY